MTWIVVMVLKQVFAISKPTELVYIKCMQTVQCQAYFNRVFFLFKVCGYLTVISWSKC